jgi:hypothetical protein
LRDGEEEPVGDKSKDDEGQAGVIPYGEAGSEASSMAESADKAEKRGKAEVATAEAAAAEATAKVLPLEAGSLNQGTAEVDVGRQIAEAASRKAAEADRAEQPK